MRDKETVAQEAYNKLFKGVFKPPFEELPEAYKDYYRRIAQFALDEANRRAELITNFLSYKAAELITRPGENPRTAVLEAIRYAGLTPQIIQAEIDEKVLALPES